MRSNSGYMPYKWFALTLICGNKILREFQIITKQHIPFETVLINIHVRNSTNRYRPLIKTGWIHHEGYCTHVIVKRLEEENVLNLSAMTLDIPASSSHSFTRLSPQLIPWGYTVWFPQNQNFEITSTYFLTSMNKSIRWREKTYQSSSNKMIKHPWISGFCETSLSYP